MNQVMKPLEDMPSGVYIGGVFFSIVAALYLFLTGKREQGIFVGLWAPTIFNLGLYVKQLHPSEE